MGKSVRPPSEQPDNQKPQPAQPDKQKQIERYIAYFCGVIFILIMLALALFVPNPTSFQLFVFRVVLALAAAGIASMTPGFLEVKVSEVIRAGGALAIFVIVYMFNPAAQVVDANRSDWRSEIEELRGNLGDLVVKWEQIDDENELPCRLIHRRANLLGSDFHNIEDKSLEGYPGEKIVKYKYAQIAYLMASDVECDEDTAQEYAQKSLGYGGRAIEIVKEIEKIPGSTGQTLRRWIASSFIRDRIQYYSALGYAIRHRYGDATAAEKVSEMLSDINDGYYEAEAIEPQRNRLLAPIINSDSTDGQPSSHPCPSTCEI